MFKLLEHDANLSRRQRSVLCHKGGDRRRPDFVGRVGDLLSVQNRKAVNLFNDVADMDGRRRRAAFDDLRAKRSQIIRRDLV